MKQNNNIDWISFFRISVASFAILSLLAFWKDIPPILYEGAYIKPELLDAIADNYSPTTYGLYGWLSKYFVTLNFDGMINALLYTYIVVLVSLIVGFLTRISAVIALLLQIIIYKSMHLYLYGADFFLTMALFYCVIFPKSKFSVDYRIFKCKQNPISMKWSLWLLQVHVCIIYFFSGLDKGLGINWWNGESVWKAVSSHDYNGIIGLGQLNISRFVFILIGIGTVAVEFLYPVFINLKITRKLWLALTVLMHVSIAVFMGLYFFAALMIILNLSAYYFPYLDDKSEEKRQIFRKKLGIFVKH
jgi:hypothetical protein